MKTLGKTIMLLALLCLLVQFVWLPGSVSAQENEGEGLQNGLVQELQQATAGKARISTHAKTGKVRFIGTEPANSIPQPTALRTPVRHRHAA